jgi:hypothetical protein
MNKDKACLGTGKFDEKLKEEVAQKEKELVDPVERAKRAEETKKHQLDAEDNEFLSLLKRSGGKGKNVRQ